jgi:hypothetical protein
MVVLPDDRVIVVGASGNNYAVGDFALGSFLKDNTVTIVPDVAGLVAVPVAIDKIELDWTLNATDATAVEVDRSTDGTNFTLLTDALSGTATTFTDTGLTEGTHYWYKVRALRAAGPSNFTNIADAWTIPAVDGLQASADPAGGVDLSWNINADPTAITSVDIERSTDGVSYTPLTTVDADSYTDPSASDGGTYWYRVRADGSGGTSQYTTPAVITFFAAPSGLTAAQISDQQINLNWINNSTAATGTMIYMSDDGSQFDQLAQVNAGINSYSVMDLDPSKT